MEALFLKIVNLSLTASWLVLAILVFRLLFRKAPKWIYCLMWGLVGLRLILPFSFESIFSLIPSAEPLPDEILYTAQPAIDSGIHIIDSTVNPILSASLSPTAGASVNPTQVWSFILACLWGIGVAAMLIYTIISYALLRRRVATATKLRNNIKESEAVDSPFVLGIFRPTIYLPYRMNEADREYVIAHEKAHIRRGDHLYKPLGFLLLSFYWFNPLLWVAYILLCRDIEGACDEKVIGTMETEDRRAYSTALLNCSVHRRRIAACPLAFGEVGVKARVKGVMFYKKPTFWLIALSVLACTTVALCFMTSPVTVRNPWVKEYVVGAENVLGTVDKEKYESVSEDFAIGADQYGRAVFKDPLKAFATMKELYSEGLKLIQEEENIPPITRRNYGSYKILGWQMTTGSEEARKQAAFISGFLDIYENSFTKEIPDTDPPMPTVPDKSVTILASHIAEKTLEYEKLKQLQEEIWAYKKAAENDETDETFRRWGAKILSAGANPGQNYVTVFVRDFGENDVRRFEKALGHCSYVLMQSEGETEQNVSSGAPISMEELSSPYLVGESYHSYSVEESEYTRYLIIRPNQAIQNLTVRTIPVEVISYTNELYSLERLDKPLVLGLVFYGDLTTYGLSFTDAEGMEHHYSIYKSGEDGSILWSGEPVLFGKYVREFFNEAWEIAQETAKEKGLTLDWNRSMILHDATGEYVAVEYYEQDSQRHVRVTFLRNEKGEYVTEPTEEETDSTDEVLRPGTIDGAFGYAPDGRPAIFLSEASKTYLDTKEEFMIINTSPFGVQKSSVEGLKMGDRIRITFITIADLEPRIVDAEKIEVISDGEIY